MSAVNCSISRKRRYSSDIRDSINPEDCLPRKRIRKHEDLPDAFKSKLQQITDWFWDLKHINKFARMAFKCGGTVLRTHRLDDDDEEEEEEEKEDDEVTIEDDDDDEIQEIKENVKQDKVPSLVNGSSFRSSHYNSHHIGAKSSELNTRYHGTTHCNLKREPVDKLKRKPLVSNPATDIEILFDHEPDVVVLEGDGIEIVSESASSKQKSARSQKSFHSSAESSKNASSSNKQAQSAPVKEKFSSPKFYTANEVVRLQEKAQYKLLLEKYINRPHLNILPPDYDTEVTDDRMFSGTHFKKHVLEQPVESFIKKYYKPCQLLPSKSAESSEKKEEPSEIVIDDDDEVQVIEMKNPTYKSVFSSRLFSGSWLSELQHNVSEQTKETNKIMEDYERQLEKYRTERLLRRLKIDIPSSPPPPPPPANIVEPEFPELTPEMEKVIDNILSIEAAGQLIIRTNSAELMRKDFDTLIGLHWLNDAVINSYFDLITERSKNEGYPSVYAFNTYFYSTLKSKGYNAVRRWTRKTDIFSFDINFVPIHLSYHWCLCVIDHRDRKILYYDSMGTDEKDSLKILFDYLCLEYHDKKGGELDCTAYTTEVKTNIPQQMNGSDCGMFTLKYAEYLSRNAEITFSQDHMQYFRRRAIYELKSAQLL